jgi:polyhydroxyalkanoate synthesis regulator phasin
MGIQSFTKVFKNEGVITFKTLKNTSICIDASVELYRASLGMKSINALTSSNGKATIHINTLLANMIKYQQHNITQIWVFDHDSTSDESKEFHNPLKIQELQKRKCAKEKAKKAIAKLTDEEDLFSDESCEEPAPKAQAKKKPTKESLEKRTFSLSKDIVNDIKLILNCLDIQWIESPAGYESEQICACLTQDNQLTQDNPNLKSDYVLSQDADTLAFGARALIKKNIKDKKYYLYQLDKIIEPLGTNGLDSLRKISVILGCDFSKKTPKIGAKTVLKKYKDTKLTEEQENAVKLFKKQCPASDTIVVNNTNKIPFTDTKKATTLVEWLESLGFSKSRIKTQLNKVLQTKI